MEEREKEIDADLLTSKPADLLRDIVKHVVGKHLPDQMDVSDEDEKMEKMCKELSTTLSSRGKGQSPSGGSGHNANPKQSQYGGAGRKEGTRGKPSRRGGSKGKGKSNGKEENRGKAAGKGESQEPSRPRRSQNKGKGKGKSKGAGKGKHDWRKGGYGKGGK